MKQIKLEKVFGIMYVCYMYVEYLGSFLKSVC